MNKIAHKPDESRAKIDRVHLKILNLVHAHLSGHPPGQPDIRMQREVAVGTRHCHVPSCCPPPAALALSLPLPQASLGLSLFLYSSLFVCLFVYLPPPPSPSPSLTLSLGSNALLEKKKALT